MTEKLLTWTLSLNTNKQTPRFIECGFPYTRNILHHGLMNPLNLSETAHQHIFIAALAKPKSHKNISMSIWRKHFFGRQIPLFIQKTYIPVSIRDVLLMKSELSYI